MGRESGGFPVACGRLLGSREVECVDVDVIVCGVVFRFMEAGK